MGKKKVLIADDIEMNRAVIAKFLKGDFEVLQAENGKEAIDILKKEQIDLLLLDIIMPVMDGLQVLEVVRKDSAFNRLGILVATSTKEKTERTALSLGADDVVSKPYDPIIIKKRLQNVLAMKEIETQKDMLAEGNIGAESFEQSRKYAIQLEASAEAIHKYAEIIKYNNDNAQLLLGVAEDMHKEAEKITLLLAEEL